MGVSDNTITVLRWVYTKYTGGTVYFKSRHVTASTGLPPQAVASALTTLDSHGVISKWRNSGSPLTWKIEI